MSHLTGCVCLCRTLVVVLAPHEDAAPVGQVIRNDGQPVPPGFHHRLHVVEAGVATQVRWLEPCINLGRFLQLDDLLCRLWGRNYKQKEKSVCDLFVTSTQYHQYLYHTHLTRTL